MVEVEIKEYSDYISYAEKCSCGTVYPLSIAEKYQYGNIFVNSKGECHTVLFWHQSGFAFISGEYDESFLDFVYDMLIDRNKTNQRRFILFTDDNQIKRYFSARVNIEIEQRYFYEYKEPVCNIDSSYSDDFELRAIDYKLLGKIKGRITPYFSWRNSEEFLAKGKGYCILVDGNVAAWAFSSAVSDNEIDIGVETDERYQHRGYAAIVSKAMVQYVISENKTPVWACHHKNIASAKLAEKIGFEKTAECAVIKHVDY